MIGLKLIPSLMLVFVFFVATIATALYPSDENEVNWIEASDDDGQFIGLYDVSNDLFLSTAPGVKVK